jgi:hypothetical protein
MRTVKLVGALCVLTCVSASAQTPSGKLTIEGLKPSPIISNLQQLTDQIGGRVPGTPAMERAIDWGVASFKAAGADSVHTEKFTIQASWAEGATTMSVVDPENFTVRHSLHSIMFRSSMSGTPRPTISIKPETFREKFCWFTATKCIPGTICLPNILGLPELLTAR